MSATPDQLPNDIEEMKRLYLAQAANLERLTAELTAAKAGLMAYALQIEKLKFQLARLRRQRFGSSSERIDREIAQLELKLEELEATKAEAKAEAKAAEREAATAVHLKALRDPAIFTDFSGLTTQQKFNKLQLRHCEITLLIADLRAELGIKYEPRES